MAVSQFALTDLEFVKRHLRQNDTSLERPGLAVFCDASDASAASVAVDDTNITLVITGGTDAGTNAIDITASANDTLTELAAVIDALSGWQARLLGPAAANSTDLSLLSAVVALFHANEVTLQIVDDWFLEQLIDSVSGMVETKLLHRNILSREYTTGRDTWYNGTGTKTMYLTHYPVTAVARVAIGRVNALEVEYDGTGTMATVEVQDDLIRLSIDSSGTHSSTDLTFAVNATITAMATAITAETGWTASALASFVNHPSTNLAPMPGQWAKDNKITLELPDQAETAYEVRESGMLVFRFGTWPRGLNNVYVRFTAGEATIPAGLKLAVTEAVVAAYQRRGRDLSLKSERLGDYSYTLADGAIHDAKLIRDVSPWMLPDAL